MKKIWMVLMALLMVLVAAGCFRDNRGEVDAKPVIYLYPQETTQVNVKLDYNGRLTCTWPEYADGWTVTARPDGSLTTGDGNRYSYLFWEGESDAEYDLSKGFVVKGEDTGRFLREKLDYMGLTPEEYNEFIVYWLPRMQENAYNLITFQQERYTDIAVLTVDPQPDSLLRIFMAWKPLKRYIEVEEPELPVLERTGFVLVEWGGTELG